MHNFYIFIFYLLSLTLFYYRNVKNNKYPDNIKTLMYEFPNAASIERVNQIFEELKASNEPNIEGIFLYVIRYFEILINYISQYIY